MVLYLPRDSFFRAYLQTYPAAVAGSAIDENDPVPEVEGGASGFHAHFAFDTFFLVDHALHVCPSLDDILY